MSASKKISLGVALVALSAAGVARGAEVSADPVCWGCRQSSCYAPVTVYSPDPCCCQRVGPVRRFLRRVFRPCCPPVRACAPPPMVLSCPPPCAQPGFAPQNFAPPAAPVQLDRPTPGLPPAPPPAVEVPGTGSSLRPAGVLTPPTPPTPIRLDRIASRVGDSGETSKLVTLVHLGKPAATRQVEADAAGRISVDLTPGTWVVYVKNGAGKNVEHGRLLIRERRVVRVQVGES